MLHKASQATGRLVSVKYQAERLDSGDKDLVIFFVMALKVLLIVFWVFYLSKHHFKRKYGQNNTQKSSYFKTKICIKAFCIYILYD